MENIIQGHKDFVRSQIEKSSGEEIDIEKAHNVGDVHPNGKWVWTEYAPGKFDWRNRKAKTNAQPSERKSVETKSATKSNPEAAKKVLDFLQLSNNKFNDITKVGALKTDKGNWSLSYDGHDVCIVGGNSLSEKTLKDAGVKIEEKKVDKNTEKIANSWITKSVYKYFNSLKDVKVEWIESFKDAKTQGGRWAMNRNGRAWTEGFVVKVANGGKEREITFDIVTNEGGGLYGYVLNSPDVITLKKFKERFEKEIKDL